MRRPADIRRDIAELERGISERTDALYALDKLCAVCGTRIETRQEAAHTKAADGSEFLTHHVPACVNGMFLELIKRSGYGWRGSLRLMR